MEREKLAVPIYLYRLLKKLPDESFKIVGYEMHRHCGESGIQIMHSFDNMAHNSLLRRFSNISAVWGSKDCYVEHDRKDVYTGVDVDGVKVFERDEGLLNGHVLGDTLVTVVYKAPSFKVRHADGTLYELNEYFYKVTGIEGVK